MFLILHQIIAICAKCWFSSFIRRKRLLKHIKGSWKAYADLSETTFRDWYRWFGRRDFDVDDNPRQGKTKPFVDAELEVFLHRSVRQTQEDLSQELVVTVEIFPCESMRYEWFKNNELGVSYELNKADWVSFFAYEELLQRHKDREASLLHSDEWWGTDPIKKHKKRDRTARICFYVIVSVEYHATKVTVCIWWYQVRFICYEALKPSETITVERYRLQLLRLSLELP